MQFASEEEEQKQMREAFLASLGEYKTKVKNQFVLDQSSAVARKYYFSGTFHSPEQVPRLAGLPDIEHRLPRDDEEVSAKPPHNPAGRQPRS